MPMSASRIVPMSSTVPTLPNPKSTGKLQRNGGPISMPTMEDILAASRAQNLDLRLDKLGPFFRITARSSITGGELGRFEGLIRVWTRGKILHLDSIRLRKETLGMEKSIFGIGLFIGAVAIRYGYDCGCRIAELLAINDTDLYHSKVAPFSNLRAPIKERLKLESGEDTNSEFSLVGK